MRCLVIEMPAGTLTAEQRANWTRRLAKGLEGVDGIDRLRLGQQAPTVRELAAIAAMKGILAGASFIGPSLQGSVGAAAEMAVCAADALLAELAKPIA